MIRPRNPIIGLSLIFKWILERFPSVPPEIFPFDGASSSSNAAEGARDAGAGLPPATPDHPFTLEA
jgi:hypothetical protein